MILGVVAIPLVFGIGGAWLGGTALGLGSLGAMAGMAAGQYLGQMLFPQKSEGQSLPKIDSFQTQTTLSGAAIPVVYGTCRLAGNIIYLGELHPYTIKHKSGGGKGLGGGSTNVTEEVRYRRSFLIGICEGPINSLSRVWKGKEQISIGDLTFFKGDGNAGLAALVGKEFADYKNLCCAWFEEYNLGNSDAVPMFQFEVNRLPPYLYEMWASGSGSYIPIVVIFNDDGTVKTILRTAGYNEWAYNVLKHANGYAYFTAGDRLYKTDLEGNPVLAFGSGAGYILVGGYASMLGYTIKVDPSGYIYGMNLSGPGSTSHPTIHKIHPDTGAKLWSIYEQRYGRYAQGGYYHDGKFYTTVDATTGDPGSNRRVLQIDPSDGTILKTFTGTTGARQLVIDPEGVMMYTCGLLRGGKNVWKCNIGSSPPPVASAAIGSQTLTGIDKIINPLTGGIILYLCGYRDTTLGKSVYVLNPFLGLEASYDTGGAAYAIRTVGYYVFVLHQLATGEGGVECNVSMLDAELNFVKGWHLDTDMNLLDLFVQDVTGGIPGTQLWLPPEVAKDIMVHTRYGAGLSEVLIDVDSYNEARQHCIDKDLQVAMKLDSQQPLLDWLDFINSHYCGFMRIG